jgi:hypothetical protein
MIRTHLPLGQPDARASNELLADLALPTRSLELVQ